MISVRHLYFDDNRSGEVKPRRAPDIWAHRAEIFWEGFEIQSWNHLFGYIARECLFGGADYLRRDWRSQNQLSSSSLQEI
jgi:hypothetical protein